LVAILRLDDILEEVGLESSSHILRVQFLALYQHAGEAGGGEAEEVEETKGIGWVIWAASVRGAGRWRQPGKRPDQT
jgi:hypothetical protein